MNVQESPQFTPSQVLDAGRRAETEGRGEYAIQFYRHLVDQYPGTGEAAAAQSALTRLGAGANLKLNGRQPPPPPIPASTSFEPRLDLPPAVPALTNPFDAPRPYDAGFQHPNGYAAHQAQPASSFNYQSQAPQAETALQVELPRVVRDYRTGRILARVFSWLGGVATICGIALLLLYILRPRALASAPLISSWVSGPSTATLLILAGMFQVMVGQLVRAVLDHSNSARDLAAVTRAEAEARYGDPETRRRRR